MTPRVLFVNHAAVLGGGELSLLDLVRGLPGRASVVLFEEGPLQDRLREEGVPVRVLPASERVLGVRRDQRAGPAAAWGVAALALRLARVARGHHVLYANSMKALAVAGLAGRLARRPVVWHLRDLLVDEHFSPSKRRVAVGLARWTATRVVANSRATRDAFVAAGGDRDRVETIYNGVDVDASAAVTPGDVARLRLEIGLGEAPVVGVFSRLAAWKGQEVLLAAIADQPDVHALVVGGALFAADAGVAASLAALAERLGITGRVHVLGARDDVPALLRVCTVVAHTSTAPEPFGRVIVEAMAAGRPIVATAAGGAVELVDDGRTGLLVPPGDARALGHALRQLLADPARAARLARAGRADAQRRFARERMQEDVRALVARVACARHGGAPSRRAASGAPGRAGAERPAGR